MKGPVNGSCKILFYIDFQISKKFSHAFKAVNSLYKARPLKRL